MAETIATTQTDPAAEEPRTFTQEEVSKLCAKEAGRAERAVLKILGIDSKDALEEYAARYQAAAGAQESLTRVTAERDSFKEKLELAQNKLAQKEQETILAGYGIPYDDMDYFLFKVRQGVTDEKEFSAAAKEYFERHPYSRASVQLTAPTGQHADPGGNEQINDAIRRAAGR